MKIRLPDDYDKQLDVDDKIYNAISNEGKLFIDKMSKMKQLKSFMICGTASKEKDIDDFIKKSKNDKWYFNVNAAGVKPGEGEQIWISGLLAKENIHTQDEELEFSKVYDKSKRNIIECPTKEYGENLKNLMINGKVLRYGLWLTQTNQNIYTAQFKYVPDVDYTIIDTDEKLLKVCGFTSDEIVQVMKYLNDFDFSQNRNELVRGTKEEPSSSPSSSEPSKSPSEMTLDELKVEFKKDYDEWSKSDEEEDFETWLKNKYPGMFIRKDED